MCRMVIIICGVRMCIACEGWYHTIWYVYVYHMCWKVIMPYVFMYIACKYNNNGNTISERQEYMHKKRLEKIFKQRHPSAVSDLSYSINGSAKKFTLLDNVYVHVWFITGCIGCAWTVARDYDQ